METDTKVSFSVSLRGINAESVRTTKAPSSAVEGRALMANGELLSTGRNPDLLAVR